MALTVLSGVIGASTALAASPAGEVTSYAIPTASSYPFGIAAGPDGNLWFTEADGNKIGRITTAGMTTEYGVPTSNSGPSGIAAGPDGNLWFTENGANKVAKITPAGVFTEYGVTTPGSGPEGIAAGPDGNLWFTENGANKVAKITPAGTVTEFPVTTANSGPFGIAAGPDGNLWFTEVYADQIARITPSGTVTEYPVPTPSGFPEGIAAGADGNLWFTEAGASKVAKITTAGTVTEYAVPAAGGAPQTPTAIAAGPDGNLWFTTGAGNRVDRITPTGTVTSYGAGGQLGGISAGLDGNMWFTEEASNAIGSIGTQSASGQPVASVNPNAHDFGSVKPGQSSQPLSVAVKNVGQAPLVVSGAQLSGARASEFAISADQCSGQTLQPGAACEIDLTYSPASQGSYSATLALSDNASDSPQQVTVTGTTPTEASVAPTSIDFGKVTAGQTSAPRSVTVTNTGGAPLVVSSAQITGPQATWFAIASDQCSGQNIQPGGSCSIGVTFAPYNDGNYNASLTIADNTAGSPQQVGLGGATPPRIPPRASVSPGSISFGIVAVGESGIQTVTVANAGGDPLNVTGVHIGGQDSTMFAIWVDHCSDQAVPSGGSCNIEVRFTPPADHSFAAALSISDDASDSPQQVALAGHGITRGTITGHVINIAVGNQPVAGATVVATLTGTRKLSTKYILNPDSQPPTLWGVTNTDANGVYSFEELPAGNWHVEVTTLGLDGAAITAATDGAVTTQDFELHPPRPLSRAISVLIPWAAPSAGGSPVIENGQPWAVNAPVNIPAGQPNSTRDFATLAGIGQEGGVPAGTGFNLAGVIMFAVHYDVHGTPDRMSNVIAAQLDCGPTGVPSPCARLLANAGSAATATSARLLASRPLLRASQHDGPIVHAGDCGGGGGPNGPTSGATHGQFYLTATPEGGVIINVYAGFGDYIPITLNPLITVSKPAPKGNPFTDFALALGADVANGIGNGIIPGAGTMSTVAGILSSVTNVLQNPSSNAGIAQGLSTTIGIAVDRLANGSEHGAIYFGLSVLATGVGELLPPVPPAPAMGPGSGPCNGPGGGGGGGGGLGGDLYLDPSGLVATPGGVPIARAKVTLTRSSTPKGHQIRVPAGSTLMSPANRRNPDLTGLLGQFGWDVLPGYYQITATRRGCRAPNGASSQRTAIEAVPPPVENLVLRLRCPHLRRAATHTMLKVLKGPDRTLVLQATVTPASRRLRRKARATLVGELRFRLGGHPLATRAFDSRTGVVFLDLPPLRPGTRTFAATFDGDADFAPSRASVRVR